VSSEFYAPMVYLVGVQVHECQFYPHHRENDPPGFNIYCEQCVCGVPHGDPEDYYVD